MYKLKNNKGFTQIDIVVSIFILMLFVTLIASLFYNSYVSSTLNKRNAEATAYLTQIFEAIDLIDYDKLDNSDEGIVAKINTIDSSKISGEYVENISLESTLSTPYKVQVKIQNYNETEGNTDKEDLIKIITVTIKYNVNKKEQQVSAQRLKTREIAYEDSLEIIPTLLEGMTPLCDENKMQATSKYATNWFDYSNQKVAEVTLNDVLSIDNNGKITTPGSEFVYIPRFAYSVDTDSDGNTITNIKFLNTDNTCKDGSSTTIYTETDTIENGKYYVPTAFTQSNLELDGIWVGKYLCKKNTDGINENIYVASSENNPEIWTGLTDAEKQEQIANMTIDGNNYGLTQDTTVKIVDSNISNLIEKLKTSSYSFISDAILENESDYTGSFRIYIY